MQIRTARYVLGSTLLAAHFAMIAIFVTVAPVLAGYDFTEALAGVVTVAPVTAIYTTLFIRYVARFPTAAPSEVGARMDAAPFAVQLAVILFISALLIGGTLFLLLSGAFAPETAKAFSGTMDTLFGAYLAAIFGRLFPPELVGQG